MTALPANLRVPHPNRAQTHSPNLNPNLTLVGTDPSPRSQRLTARTADPAAVTDLRRKRSRDETDRLLHLAQWLPAPERALIEAVFRDHRTCVEAGALVSQTPRQVRKRLRALVARLTDPPFELVVRSRDRWPVMRRRIGSTVFLQGRTQREAAAHLQLSHHTVRSEV